MSAICGGLIKKSQFLKNPNVYMMSMYMDDKKCERYIKMKDLKQKQEYFNKYAISAI